MIARAPGEAPRGRSPLRRALLGRARHRRLTGAAALACAAGAIFLAAAPSPAQNGTSPAAAPDSADPSLVRTGAALFQQTCASCHGRDARGIPGVAPDLHGVGALAADFYLRTGRMPLRNPHDEPRRARSPFSGREIAALTAYVGSLGGPAIPRVDPARGDLATGRRLFAASCMGCHQVLARGGITTGATVPSLQQASVTDVAEAVAIGPYVMPQFRGQFDQRELDSLARYVLWTRRPADVGGWGIGHIGPIPEGMVTWLLAAFALLLVMRLIGERTTR